MNLKYCLPVIEESKDRVFEKISEYPDYEFYEIWLSYIKDLDTDFVWKISDTYNGKLIFLFRKKDLEKTSLVKEDREKIIKLIENSGNFLDLDINDQSEDLEYIKKDKLNNKLLVSYHNYKETPDLQELEKLVSNMEEYKPEIFKVACFCKEPEDGVKLLTLLLKIKKENKKFIVTGMGEEGKIVRIYSALWGNEFNFTPADIENESAPGQITRDELQRMIEVIKNGG
jgi:3-dehydroquinate dehydratase I